MTWSWLGPVIVIGWIVAQAVLLDVLVRRQRTHYNRKGQ